MILYQGKVKDILEGPEPGTVLVRFRDDVTAGDGKKRARFVGKGRVSREISEHLFQYLERQGVPTHYVGPYDVTSFVAKKVNIIPLEVVVRNVATGSLVRRLGIPEGKVLDPPLMEFFYKNDALHDPLICRNHVFLLGICDAKTLDAVEVLAEKANHLLKGYFQERGLRLIDIKFEFGRDPDGRLVLADELGPDIMRVWTLDGRSLDKDVFRQDKGNLMEAYHELRNAVIRR